MRFQTYRVLLSIQTFDLVMPDSNDNSERKSVSSTLEFGPPKFQATIPEHVRRILDVTEDDLEYVKGEKVEKVVVSAELTIEDIYTKSLSSDE